MITNFFNRILFKSLSISFLLMLAVTVSNAQDIDSPWHLVAFENGKEVASYNTEVVKGIKTTPQSITVVLDNGIEFLHPIVTTTFSFAPRKVGTGTANDAMISPKWNVQYAEGRLYFSETLSGALVVGFVGNCTEIPVYLRQGIYIVQVEGKSVKLLVGKDGYGGASRIASP